MATAQVSFFVFHAPILPPGIQFCIVCPGIPPSNKSPVSPTFEKRRSGTLVGTFLINEDIAPGFPVVSLSTDSLLLFDTIHESYTKGPNAQTNEPFYQGNFWQKIEFPIHFEFFNLTHKRVFEQSVGGRIFGNHSRTKPQKSFKLIARKQYGKKRMEYAFFPNRDCFKYKQLLLRNSGNDWNHAHLRDGFIQNRVEGKTHLDVQTSRACVVFLNGKYWGIYHLKESIGQHMIASHHGLNPDYINLLEYNNHPKEGHAEDFKQVFNFTESRNLSLPAVFDSLATHFDIRNFTDYWAVEVWAANWDWMPNNVRFWREASIDSPWRYILWDLDWGMDLARLSNATLLDFHYAKNGVTHIRILKAMLHNESFKTYFVNRNADLLNTLFEPEAMQECLDSTIAMMSPEMHRHFATWGDGFQNDAWGSPGYGSHEKWLSGNVNQIQRFIDSRQQSTRDELQQVLELGEQAQIHLQVVPPAAGKIHINTVDVDEFPWQGVYFEGIPVTLTTVPNPGFEFSFWQNGEALNGQSQRLVLQPNPTHPDSLTAYFSGFPETPILTIQAFNYMSSPPFDCGDWVELYNPGDIPFDLSG